MNETSNPFSIAGRRKRKLEPPRKLSEELIFLREHAAKRTLTLREVILVLGARAYSLLLILLSLPFVTPIPIPGLSTPFGLAIALITLRLTLGQRPWLPKKLQRRQIPPGFLDKTIAVSAGVIRFLEKFMRPRLAILTEYGWQRQVHAFLMFLSAAVLFLPVPIPFTNAFPAWMILFMAGGLLERDGLFVIAAYVIGLAGVAYIVLLGGAATQMIEAIRQWLMG